MRIKDRGERAVSRRAVEIGGDAGLTLDGAAGDWRKPAQIARRNGKLAVYSCAAEKTGETRVQGWCGEVERVKRHFAARRRCAPHGQRDFGTDGPIKGWVGESKTAQLSVARESDPGRRVAQRAVWRGAQCRGDTVERSFGDTDLPGVEGGVERRAGKRALDRRVEIELSDCAGARNCAGVDFEIEIAIRRRGALDVEPGGRRNEMQAGDVEARILVEDDIALQRRFAGEDRLDNAGRQALEPRFQVQREAPRAILAGESDLSIRPHVGAGGEIELGLEGVERTRPVECEPHRRQAGKLGEMGEEAAGRLGGIDIERELLGGRNEAKQHGQAARGVESLGAEMQIEPLGRRPERRLARKGKTRRDADDRLSERKLLHRELLDDHLDRQFRQDRPRSRRVGRRRGSAPSGRRRNSRWPIVS